MPSPLFVGMIKAVLISLRTCIIRIQNNRLTFACAKRHFNLSADAIFNVHNVRLCTRCAIKLLKVKRNSFIMPFGQGVYILEESLKSIQDVIGNVYCPRKNCLNREKCESLESYVTTLRSIYGFGKCEAWLFVHKKLFTSQEHVKATKQTKHVFHLLKKVKFLPDKQFFVFVPFQSNKYRQNELIVDNNVQKTRDVCCPICGN